MVRIRALRDAYGLTAEQVADRMAELGVPVDRNTLYNIESGAKKPSERVLDAYARALGVNPLDVWQGPLRKPAASGRPDKGSTGPPRVLDPIPTITAGAWPGQRLRWRCYVEQHALSATPNARRKLAGTARAAATPETELFSPAQVADWLARRATEIRRTAGRDAQRLNLLKDIRWSVTRSVAARGRSVYVSVHVAPGRVIDLCAEAVRAADPRP
ncbi:MAG TPA: helix-turn-helix transcriptional regulator [Pseudonocardiaceae bacterium]|jgi:transcriptional regulator with XRE-family HTH domain|nr:helix-turn-helix transcriptional regulator [Pseudonocardiaceae bacterium]